MQIENNRLMHGGRNTSWTVENILKSAITRLHLVMASHVLHVKEMTPSRSAKHGVLLSV